MRCILFLLLFSNVFRLCAQLFTLLFTLYSLYQLQIYLVGENKISDLGSTSPKIPSGV